MPRALSKSDLVRTAPIMPIEDRHMCATARICVGLVVALAVYILELSVLLQDVDARAPQNTAETSFLGR